MKSIKNIGAAPNCDITRVNLVRPNFSNRARNIIPKLSIERLNNSDGGYFVSDKKLISVVGNSLVFIQGLSP